MLTEYRHAPGDRCDSASLRNLADHHDWGFDDPACFGLGVGIGIGDDDRGPAFRMIMGRSAHLEPTFFDHFGVPAVHEHGQSRDAAWRALGARLASGPVLCFVDLYDFPYFGSDTHFGRHTVVVTGVDDDTVIVSDTESPELLCVSRDVLDDAWTSNDGFGQPDWCWIAVDDPALTASVEEVTRDAIGLATETMQHGREGLGSGGVDAIQTFADVLPEWLTLDDMQWMARFADQNIEHRGTDRGTFRRLYAGFLDTLETDAGLDPQFGGRLHRIVDDWTALGEELKVVSETDAADERASLLADASDRARDLADREDALFANLTEVA